VVLGDLPAMLPNFTAIPDSVQSLVFTVDEKPDYGYTLTFGLDSQIRSVKVITTHPSLRQQSLLLFSSSSLKYFRSSLEFSK
jgi:hypothetical protein